MISPVANSRGMIRVTTLVLLLATTVVLASCGGGAGGKGRQRGGAMMAKNVLTHNLSEPLGSATTAKIDIDTGTGNLMIDRLAGGEPGLARGTLQYL
jgi:hypothetical protein